MVEIAPTSVDPNAITTVPDQDPFTLVPVIRDLLRTRYCVPGTIFLVEGIEFIPMSKTGRWQAVRLLLGDGEFCVQALLSADCHRFVETGEVSTGFYVKLDQFDLEWEAMDPDDCADAEKANQKMVFLALHDLTTIGWNDSYRAMLKQHGDAAATPESIASPQKEKEKGKAIHEAAPPSPPSPEVEHEEEAVGVKPELPSSGYGDDVDMDDAFENMERILFPSSKKASTPKAAPPSRAQGPVALPRDWVDRQVPLKLTTLHAIPSLPYAQNWTCNILAIIASLSPVGASYLPPYKQRTARLTDPSTAKQVHLTVFLDPETFNPAIGSAVLLTGVKNHRFDGGSLKKYASDSNNGREWWFEDPIDMMWCDVAGIKSWWKQMEGNSVELPILADKDGQTQREIQLLLLSLVTSDFSTVWVASHSHRPSLQISPSGTIPRVLMELQGLDTHERQRVIDGFLSDLSSWDLLYLRRRLHYHESRIKLASLEDLPGEIIIYISQFLELEDLLTCANVCRSWQQAWTFGAVTASLCCRYFPGLTEKHDLPHSAGQSLFAEHAKLYIDKYLRPRPNAYFSSRWFVGTNESACDEDMRQDAFHRSECLDFGLDSFQMRYADGLLVWQPEDGYVVVNDLRTLTRSRCSFGSSLVAGRKLDLQAVTRKLIVFSSIDLNTSSQVCREL
ncbi:hypothetical protein V2A60_002614 [Cordyceps javanica]